MNNKTPERSYIVEEEFVLYKIVDNNNILVLTEQ